MNSLNKSWDERWDTIYEKGHIANYPNEHVIKFIFGNFSRIVNRRDIKILELGCGGGNNLWMLSREGYDAYGFDGSRKALELTGEKLKNENLKARLMHGDFLNLPYNDNFFNAVIDDAAVESNRMDNIKHIFQEIYRVTKKGGKYHGMLISSDSKNSMAGKEIEKNTFLETGGGFIKRERIMHFFDKDEIKKILKYAGFVDIEVNYFLITKNNSKDFIKFWLVDATK